MPNFDIINSMGNPFEKPHGEQSFEFTEAFAKHIDEKLSTVSEEKAESLLLDNRAQGLFFEHDLGIRETGHFSPHQRKQYDIAYTAAVQKLLDRARGGDVLFRRIIAKHLDLTQSDEILLMEVLARMKVSDTYLTDIYSKSRNPSLKYAVLRRTENQDFRNGEVLKGIMDLETGLWNRMHAYDALDQSISYTASDAYYIAKSVVPFLTDKATLKKILDYAIVARDHPSKNYRTAKRRKLQTLARNLIEVVALRMREIEKSVPSME